METYKCYFFIVSSSYIKNENYLKVSLIKQNEAGPTKEFYTVIILRFYF